MSEQMFDSARPGAASLPLAIGSFGPVIEAAARTGNACGKAYLRWQDEILRFTSTRLQRDAEFGSNLLRCDKWADAARLQQSWVASTVEDYVTEANRLLELASDLTANMTRTAGESARETGETGDAAAENVSRFTRAAGEQAAAMSDDVRKAGDDASRRAVSVADESRKAVEETVPGKDRGGAKRR